MRARAPRKYTAASFDAARADSLHRKPPARMAVSRGWPGCVVRPVTYKRLCQTLACAATGSRWLCGCGARRPGDRRFCAGAAGRPAKRGDFADSILQVGRKSLLLRGARTPAPARRQGRAARPGSKEDGQTNHVEHCARARGVSTTRFHSEWEGLCAKRSRSARVPGCTGGACCCSCTSTTRLASSGLPERRRQNNQRRSGAARVFTGTGSARKRCRRGCAGFCRPCR